MLLQMGETQFFHPLLHQEVVAEHRKTLMQQQQQAVQVVVVPTREDLLARQVLQAKEMPVATELTLTQTMAAAAAGLLLLLQTQLQVILHRLEAQELQLTLVGPQLHMQEAATGQIGHQIHSLLSMPILSWEMAEPALQILEVAVLVLMAVQAS
jgi:hypothetical protein